MKHFLFIIIWSSLIFLLQNTYSYQNEYDGYYDNYEDEMEAAYEHEEAVRRCSRNYKDCEDLENPRILYEECMDIAWYDIHQLDADGDWIPCEDQLVNFWEYLYRVYFDFEVTRNGLIAFILSLFHWLLFSMFFSIIIGKIIYRMFWINEDLSVEEINAKNIPWLIKEIYFEWKKEDKTFLFVLYICYIFLFRIIVFYRAFYITSGVLLLGIITHILITLVIIYIFLKIKSKKNI